MLHFGLYFRWFYDEFKIEKNCKIWITYWPLGKPSKKCNKCYIGSDPPPIVTKNIKYFFLKLDHYWGTFGKKVFFCPLESIGMYKLGFDLDSWTVRDVLTETWILRPGPLVSPGLSFSLRTRHTGAGPHKWPRHSQHGEKLGEKTCLSSLLWGFFSRILRINFIIFQPNYDKALSFNPLICNNFSLSSCCNELKQKKTRTEGPLNLPQIQRLF